VFGGQCLRLTGALLMTRSSFSQAIAVAGFAAVIAGSLLEENAAGQRRRLTTHASICGNPQVPCKTIATFQPNDLPFRVPKNAVIVDTELFYAIILKSVGVGEQDCDVFVPEKERRQTQALFPDHKVFASRCADPETLFYTGMSPKHRFMAVYAGTTLAEAKRMLGVVRATGKFPGANIRRMRTGFNGT
jgi:hypothetical protein